MVFLAFFVGNLYNKSKPLTKKGMRTMMQSYEKQRELVSKLNVIDDVLCQDSSGDYFNIEVQKKNDDDHQKRVRFNRSNIDTAFVESGIKYEQLPDVYLIFLTKFDIFREKHTIYHMERVIKETGTVVENGTHEIYVNTAIDDGTEIAKLMQYFKKSAGVHQKFQKLSKRVQYFKESQKGVTEMCELVEEYAKNMQKRK